MFNRIIFLILLMTFFGCKKNLSDCGDITYNRVYALRMGNNGVVSFRHYILVGKYSSECFSSINFSAIAKRYIDTCSINKPVRMISFLRSVEDAGFETGELDSEIIQKQEIIGFHFHERKIDEIYFVRENVRKVIKLGDCDFNEE